MVELKNHQQQETTGKVQLHLRLMLMAQVPWDSILSTVLKNVIQWCMSSSSFFLIIHNTVALDCILNNPCNLHTILNSGPVTQKLTAPPQLKKIPLPFPVSWISSVTSSSCLSSSFLWASNSIRLVSSLWCRTRISTKSSTCRCSSSFSLSFIKLLKTSLNYSSNFSNSQKSWTKCKQRFQIPFLVTAKTECQAKSIYFMAL